MPLSGSSNNNNLTPDFIDFHSWLANIMVCDSPPDNQHLLLLTSVSRFFGPIKQCHK